MMMKILLSVLFSIAIIESFSQANFPDLSPKGSVRQKVGFTTISVDYERPAARGRKIIGELVPYDKLWRTGAGNCTRVRFSENVSINSMTISAGTYSLFTIPNSVEWTVILNSDTTLYGSQSYDKNKDIFRFKAKSEATSRYYESFTIDIDVIPYNAAIYLAWENTQIHFKVETGTDKRTIEFINQNLLTDKSDDPDQYATAVEYYLYSNKDLDKALILVNKAITKNPKQAWFYALKVDVLEKQKQYTEAIAAGNAELEFMQKYGKEIGWSAETQRVAIEACKARIESMKRKLEK